MRVYLSASTQAYNMGYGLYGSEQDRMCELAYKIKCKLETKGIEVFRNRQDIPISEIVRDSNKNNVDIHVSLHSNAGNGLARGLEIYCHKFGSEGEKLASSIYDELISITPAKGRGVKEGYKLYNGQPLYETAYTDAPACLMEIGFHDNKEDALWIVNNMETIADSIVKGILKYLKIGVNEMDNTPDNYAKAYIEKAISDGVLKGDETGDLKLHEPITRQDMIVMLYRALGK